MHWLCRLLGHKYITAVNYDKLTGEITHLVLSCPRCGHMSVRPTIILPRSQKTQKSDKPRTRSPERQQLTGEQQ